MAKLVFVTGATTTGKSQYIRNQRNSRGGDVMIDEVPYSQWELSDIHRMLSQGTDVYVSWTLPEGAEIQIVTEDMR